MTPNLVKWILAAAVLLVGCTDDATRLAGGTGSDLPYSARLLDTNLRPVAAKVWRLWSLDDDSAQAITQVVDSTNDGFVLPRQGRWIVEAWKDSAQAGLLEGLPKAHYSASEIAGCPQMLTYLPSESRARVGVPPCATLIPPSAVHRPSSPRPLGVGVFGMATAKSVQQLVYFPTATDYSTITRFRVWQIQDTVIKRGVIGGVSQVTSYDSVGLFFSEIRFCVVPHVVNISLPPGKWLFEGYSPEPRVDSLFSAVKWQKPGELLYVDPNLIRDSCVAKPKGVCTTQPGRAFEGPFHMVVIQP